MRYRNWLIVALLLVVAGGGYYLLQQRSAAQAATEFEVIRQESVRRDRLESTVNATGSIEPEAELSLTFGLGGTIQQVNVARGQSVSAGEVLATLDTAELELAVQQAADALTIQQLTLQQRRDNQPTAATLATAQADIDATQASVAVAEANQAAAEAGLLQAEAQKALLQAGPTADAIAAADAEIAARTAEVETVQDAYDRIIEFGVGGTTEEQTRFQLNAAQQALAAAEARRTALFAGPRPADLQAADAQIASAEANLQAAAGNVLVAQANVARAQAAFDRLLEPPTAAELAILEAQVASAETNLALAQLRLEQAQIVAPIGGTVASVTVNQGELATPGAPAVTLLVEDAFHIDVNVDEIDIDQVDIGQAVRITLDALPDRPVTGTVAEIAPTSGALTGGVVSYLVTINIDLADQSFLRPGMSANAAIVVDQLVDVLVIPNWAVKLDRETGVATVLRFTGTEAVEEVTIETGLRNEQFIEVRAGLSEGDEVVITSERETFSFFGGGG